MEMKGKLHVQVRSVPPSKSQPFAQTEKEKKGEKKKKKSKASLQESQQNLANHYFLICRKSPKKTTMESP